ncbi:signal peptidase I [Actinoplanes sp. NPDC049599]|jgi:signal peptidase I|uniref:signal peptidase I n=1 Tax=Actinoplanes sp. NPDC049599 TaxID=3363903 RepID=UPI0037B632F6
MRRAARAVLVAAVRGRRDRGGPWGEAALAEFDQTTGRWEAVRWAAGGLRAVWHERRAKIKTMPTRVRVQRAAIGAALLALPAAVVVNQFVLTPRYIPSGSMEPTVQVQDRILIDRVSFRLTGIRYGDIVEFTTPQVPGRHVLKRVIGLPGDTIECRGGAVFRDGAALPEPYLESVGDTTDCGAPVTVPAGALFVLGDHRLVSQDSRQWGTIPQDAVDGRLLTRIWPLP